MIRRWVVPAFYPDFFELMCAWLPREQWEGIDCFTVLTPEEKKETIWGITQRYIPDWEVRVFSYEFIDAMMGDVPRVLGEYELRTKMYVNHVFQDSEILYTDDDIVVQRDPSHALGTSAWWSSVHTDGFYLTNKQDVQELLMLEEVFGEAIDVKHFNRTRTEAGLWWLPEGTSLESYRDLLVEYFAHPLNVKLMDGKAKVRRRYRDQRFLSVFYDLYADGAPNRANITTFNGPFDRRTPKSFPKKEFIHYAAGRHKPDYVAYLWEQLNARS